MELPTMRASHVTELAANFARQLAEELDSVNQKYPAAVLNSEFHDIVARAYAGTLPGPTPTDSIPAFERLFLLFIASRYVIVPDQP